VLFDVIPLRLPLFDIHFVRILSFILVLQQSDTNYYDQNQMEYQLHHDYEQEVIDAAYYNHPPVFLRQPVGHLM